MLDKDYINLRKLMRIVKHSVISAVDTSALSHVNVTGYQFMIRILPEKIQFSIEISGVGADYEVPNSDEIPTDLFRDPFINILNQYLIDQDMDAAMEAVKSSVLNAFRTAKGVDYSQLYNTADQFFAILRSGMLQGKDETKGNINKTS